MYKTLFFALVSVVLWIGSLILSFFTGAVVMSMFDNRPRRPGLYPTYGGIARRPRARSSESAAD